MDDNPDALSIPAAATSQQYEGDGGDSVTSSGGYPGEMEVEEQAGGGGATVCVVVCGKHGQMLI